MENVIRTMKPPCEEEVTMRSPLWALFMGFEHEKIHLETSSVLFRQVCLRVPHETSLRTAAGAACVTRSHLQLP